jgi:hypothetical protein
MNTQSNEIVLRAIDMSSSVDMVGTSVSTPFGAVTLELLDLFECAHLMAFYNGLYFEGGATSKSSALAEMDKVEAHMAVLRQFSH